MDRGVCPCILIAFLAILAMFFRRDEPPAPTSIKTADQMPFVNNTLFSTAMQQYINTPPSRVLFVWGRKDVGKSTNIKHDCQRWEQQGNMCVILSLKSFAGKGQTFLGQFIDALSDGIKRTNFDIDKKALARLSNKDGSWLTKLSEWWPILEGPIKFFVESDHHHYVSVVGDLLNYVSKNPDETVDTFSALLEFINNIGDANTKSKIILVISEFQQIGRVLVYGKELSDALFQFFNSYKDHAYSFWTIVESSDALFVDKEELNKEARSYIFYQVPELGMNDIIQSMQNLLTQDEIKHIYDQIGGISGLWADSFVAAEKLKQLKNGSITTIEAIDAVIKEEIDYTIARIALIGSRFDADSFKVALSKIIKPQGLTIENIRLDPYYTMLHSNLLYVTFHKYVVPQNRVVEKAIEQFLKSERSVEDPNSWIPNN